MKTYLQAFLTSAALVGALHAPASAASASVIPPLSAQPNTSRMTQDEIHARIMQLCADSAIRDKLANPDDCEISIDGGKNWILTPRNILAGLGTLLLAGVILVRPHNKKEKDPIHRGDGSEGDNSVPEAKQDSSPIPEEGEIGVDLLNSEVDSVVHADLCLTFGGYDQAETILNEARKVDPTKVAILLKLLEVYVGRGDNFKAKALLDEIQAMPNLKPDEDIRSIEIFLARPAPTELVLAPEENPLDPTEARRDDSIKEIGAIPYTAPEEEAITNPFAAPNVEGVVSSESTNPLESYKDDHRITIEDGKITKITIADKSYDMNDWTELSYAKGHWKKGLDLIRIADGTISYIFDENPFGQKVDSFKNGIIRTCDNQGKVIIVLPDGNTLDGYVDGKGNPLPDSKVLDSSGKQVVHYTSTGERVEDGLLSSSYGRGTIVPLDTPESPKDLPK